MDLYVEFQQLVAKLQDAKLEYAVCGGVAVAIMGFTRFTKDIDILVRAEDLSKVMDAAAECGFNMPARPMTFGVNTPLEMQLRRVTKVIGTQYMPLDLMLVTPVLEDVWASREIMDWKGQTVMAVSLEGLAKMKRLSGRDKDKIDIERLTEIKNAHNRTN
jgi:hypothetical protein